MAIPVVFYSAKNYFISAYKGLLHKILNIDADRIFAATRVYQFMVVSTFFTIVTVPYDAVLNAHENMLYYAIVGIIEALLKLGTALFVAYTNGKHYYIHINNYANILP
jgi:Na+-driven multidrug efflux pump